MTNAPFINNMRDANRGAEEERIRELLTTGAHGGIEWIEVDIVVVVTSSRVIVGRRHHHYVIVVKIVLVCFCESSLLMSLVDGPREPAN